VAVADELVPSSMRGGIVGKTGNIGNCIDVRYEDYERAFVEMIANACSASNQSVRILFKRSSCPKPPSIPGLIPAKERSNKRLQLTAR
jgi:hypothetical protein